MRKNIFIQKKQQTSYQIPKQRQMEPLMEVIMKLITQNR